MSRVLTKAKWRRRKRIARIICFTIIILSIITGIGISTSLLVPKKVIRNFISNNKGIDNITVVLSNKKVIKLEYLTPNPYSRPQKRLRRINAIVVHYTANPGTSAENNRSYFNGLADKHTTSASSHYIIGLKGEIIQCIPLTEVAYASNHRNNDTVSIECCHPDKTGKFNKKTYRSLVSLIAALCVEFDLDKKDIIRHYDVTGKLCPLYYVEHEDAWEALKEDVGKEIVRYQGADEKTVHNEDDQNYVKK